MPRALKRLWPDDEMPVSTREQKYRPSPEQVMEPLVFILFRTNGSSLPLDQWINASAQVCMTIKKTGLGDLVPA